MYMVAFLLVSTYSTITFASLIKNKWHITIDTDKDTNA